MEDMGIYHIFNKSISRFKIFNSDDEYQRILQTINYYRNAELAVKFSEYIQKTGQKTTDSSRLVDIVTYCIMPTHIHLVLQERIKGGISTYMSNICNSYTRYFNYRHNRKGPLWVGRYKRVNIESDEQLLHLTRYIHLNPVTAFLVTDPVQWPYSSYREYIGMNVIERSCFYGKLLDINPQEYQKFVLDGIDYHRRIALIKHLVFDLDFTSQVSNHPHLRGGGGGG